MKRKITDRVRDLGYRVETSDGHTFKVYEDKGTHYEYYGTFTKAGLKEEFNV